jgi:hypothetical protein
MPTLGLVAQGTEQVGLPAHESAPGRPTSTGSNAHRSSAEPEGQEAFPGSVTVVLPGGQTVLDPFTGSQLKSPVADLAPVAVAGREVGNTFRAMLQNPDTTAGAGMYLATSLGIYLGQGGRFDYQRQGNRITGFTQLRQYKDVSNFNVGLFCQQAGLSLDESLRIAGGYATFFSSNANRDLPFGLDPRTRDLITTGYDIGTHGVFGQAATPPSALQEGRDSHGLGCRAAWRVVLLLGCYWPHMDAIHLHNRHDSGDIEPIRL